MKTSGIHNIIRYLFIVPVALLLGCSSKNAGEITGSGTLEATDVSISAKVPGEILKLYVDEGSHVKAGDTLAVLDHADNEIQLNQAQANLESAEAQY